MVEKAPGADHAPLPAGQGAAYHHAFTEIGGTRCDFFDLSHQAPRDGIRHAAWRKSLSPAGLVGR